MLCLKYLDNIMLLTQDEKDKELFINKKMGFQIPLLE
jgi:hypothetical protein